MYISAMVSLSYFLRRSGDVLRQVDEADVVLERRDADDLVLTTEPRAEAVRDALGLFASLVRSAVDDDAGRPVVASAMASSVPWTAFLHSDERARLASDVAEASATSSELGVTQPLVDALDRWRHLARSRARQRPVSAHTTRPVAIPDDVGDPHLEKATGVVELPLHVRWSAPQRSYDLADPRQRRLVYEQVLSEGLDDDVRRFIDVNTLIEDWDRLVLPPRVRRAWADWLRRRRRVEVAC